MTDLTAIPPLGGTQPLVEKIGDIGIVEVIDRALASIAVRAGQDAALSELMASKFEIGLPEAGQCLETKPSRIWWMGPGQWMMDGDHDSREDLAAELKAALGDVASVTEQTDGWCRFDVSGSDLSEMFARLCGLDFAALKSGAATRTLLHHQGCFVILSELGASVLGPRSSAGSLHHALVAAAKSVA